MISRFFRRLTLAIALLGAAQTASAADNLYEGAPIKALLITGGCCHNYTFQSEAMTKGVSAQASVTWKVINEGGRGTRGEIDLYNDPDWAAPYDVVVHNECFADTDDPEYVRKITAAHKAGKPAVVVHCAMHTYRSADFDDWREFLGVTSRYHDHQSNYPVKIVKGDHPTMKGFPMDWTTPKDELYVVDKLWPTATALATSVRERGDHSAQPVIWVNDYHGTRVFGTTYGHSDDTFKDPIFINLLARGIVWSAGK